MTDETPATGLGRRTVLQGAVFAGAGVVLVGCGSDEPAASTPTPSDAGGDSPTDETTPPDSAPEVLAKASDVPVDGGVIVDEVVVTQPTNGEFAAFSAVCTHQGCLVDDVTEGVISCPCHGSQYSVADGSVLAGPAPSPLSKVQIEVKQGEVIRA